MELARQKQARIFAAQIRIETLKALGHLGFGHLGGSLSIADLLAVLYSGEMKVDPANPNWEDRDFLVCSKGHAGPAIYATLALRGFFPKEELATLNRPGTKLPSHCDKNKTPGIDCTTGSLGQGTSQAVGMALGAKHTGNPCHVYTIIGDGESQEGLVWEASMAAAHYHLDNLTVIFDHNGLQIDGSNDQVMSLGDIGAKFAAFGYDIIEVKDGNDMQQVLDALHAPACPGKPRLIWLHTLKGKGVSYMEGQVGWHGKAPNAEQCAQALKDLEG